MKRRIVCLLMVSVFLVACNRSSTEVQRQEATKNVSQTVLDLPDLERALGNKVTEKIVKPLANKIIHDFDKNNPGLFQNIYKQRNFTPLHQAAWNNQVATAKELLAAHAEVNAKDIDGSTPLHSAAFAFGVDVIPILIQAGADIDACDKAGATPLHHAMRSGSESSGKAISHLLKANANVNARDNEGFTPLFDIVYLNNTIDEKIKQLIAAGADVNLCAHDGTCPLHRACSSHRGAVDLLIAAGANVNAIAADGRTPLHYAAQNGNSNIIASLLKAKADLNARNATGWSPMALAAENCCVSTSAALRDAGAKEDSWTKLHEAAIFGKPEVVAKLLDDKSNVNSMDIYGRTPLFWALRCNEDKVADLLIDAGAELNCADHQHITLLQLAAWAKRPDIVRKAVAAGADVNATDDDGYAALHHAAASGVADTVEFLLGEQAQVNIASNSGVTPLMMALDSDNPEVVEQLLDAGADVLATDNNGNSIENCIIHVFNRDIRKLVQNAILDATEKRTDAICHLYDADNPNALKADAVKASTPNLAAVKMYRALFDPDKKKYLSMFAGSDRDLAVAAALYDATQSHVAFRKELTQAFGPDACRKFQAMQIDNMTWSYTTLVMDERDFERMKTEIQGDRAVCHGIPGSDNFVEIRFVRKNDHWLIDPACFTPIGTPGGFLRLFSTISRCAEKGRSLIRQPGSKIKDIKRAMFEEFKAGT